MLKPKLMRIVEEVLEMGGSHDPAKDIELRGRFLDFLREKDHLILHSNNINLVIARDMIHFLDANKIFAETTNGKKSYPHAKSFLERLMVSDFNEWHYYELKLLSSSIHFTENIEQAMELASKAEKRILQFKGIRLTELMEGALASNMCARLLYAKYFDSDVNIDLVTSEFKIWFRKIEKLTEEDQRNSQLSLLLLVTRIREALFEGYSTGAYQLCEELESYPDPKITKLINDEVHFYTTSEEYTNFGLIEVL